MFIVALFMIDKSWKQHKCPSAEDWIKKMWCVYIYGKAMRRNEIQFAGMWMDLEIIILK